MPVEDDVVELLVEALPEQLSEFPDSVPGDPGFRQFTRRSEARVEQHVLRTRAPAGFMSTTMNQRLQLNTRTNIERADAFGAVELVAYDGQEINTQLLHVRRDLSD